MKRIVTLTFSLALATANYAQISIGQNEMPHAGDELLRTQANANPFLNFAATGPAYTWNFATLTAAAQQTKAYQSVSSTNFVYALAYADIFFNANRANHATEGTDIPFNDLLPIENPYTFLYHSNSTYKKVGFGVELSGIPVPIAFSEHDVVYELPLNYGDASTSSSSWEISIPTLAHYGYEQERTNEVDGWGTITTPSGTFDVLRVKTTLAGRDTINIDTLSLGFTIDRPIVREYKWLAEDLRVPVLQINTTELFGTEIVSEIYFYDMPRSVSVVQPLALTLCPGGPVAVSYDATGAFNAGGFLQQGNVFRAQLSDANGSFAAPVNIGSVTATVSGVINATIPANTPLGTGYRIRVIATNPAYVGADNGVDLTIGGPPQAMAFANGALEFCDGGSVLLQTDGGTSYQWAMGGDAIDGAVGASYEAMESGEYTVTVTNACGSDASDAISVVVNAAPVHALSELELASCGTPVTIASENVSGQLSVTYQWMRDGEPVDGETADAITTDVAGAYTLEVLNTATGCSYTSLTATVTIDMVLAPVVSASGATTFCDGGSVTLDAGDGTGTYQWYLDDEVLTGETGSTLAVTAGGAYTVVLTRNACASEPSEAITVTIDTAPEQPVITADGATTFCAGGSVTLDADAAGMTYQWSNSDGPIDGATNSTLTVDASGLYSVEITNAGGCSATSTLATEVVVNALPDVATITQNGSTLSASGTGAFQWYLDGEAIDGATSASYDAVAFGDYTVTVTNENGCTSTSEIHSYLSTGVGAIASAELTTYPNPTKGAFTVSAPGFNGALYAIMDATGKQVRSGRINGTLTDMDLANAEAGLYFIRISLNERTVTARIVLQR